MKKHANLVWIVALVLGWGFDLLFWGKPIGINFAIFFTACLVGGTIVLLANDLKPNLKSLWLLLPFLFFATLSAIRQEPLTVVLSIVGVLVSLGLLVVTYLGGGLTRFTLSDYFKKFFQLIGSVITLPVEYFSEPKLNLSNLRRLPLKPVVRGLLIAVPVVVFFTALLAGGDVVFGQKAYNFITQFHIGKIPETVLRLVIILAVAYLLTGVFLFAALKSTDQQPLEEDQPAPKRSLGFIEAVIVLGSVSLLFLIFVIIQFRYFFGGEVNIGVSGYTYSEYARSGFVELILVAFFSLLMILGLGTLTRRETDQQKRIYSGLSVFLALLVIVILISAYQRLMLAIDWHGFSRLRLYPRVFLVWVGILFVAVIVLEIMRRERQFALAALLASLGFAITICVLNVDASIVRHNVYRTLDGKHFNVNFLTSLSADAIPGLVAAFNDQTLPAATHDGVGAALVCYLHSEIYVSYPSNNWRSFNFSRWAAVKALNDVSPHLQDYQVNLFGGHYHVDTPNHQLQYECDQTNFEGQQGPVSGPPSLPPLKNRLPGTGPTVTP